MSWPPKADHTANPSHASLRILTPHGMAAIAVMELSGRGADHVMAALAGMIPQMVTLRSIKADEGVIDEVLIVPRGPDHFELHCHGGLLVVEKLVRRLAHLMNNEAITGRVLEDWRHPRRHLPEVETLWGVQMLARAHAHGLAEWAREQQRMLDAGGGCAEVKRQAQWLCTASAGLHRVMDGQTRIALIGPPNAGKSSLANFWLGHPMSVTSDVPGTTRDWVEQTVRVISGDLEIAARLTDTAGLRQTTDQLERLAMEGGIGTLAEMHVILLVMDITQIFDPQHLQAEAWQWAMHYGLADKLAAVPWIAVGTKCDLLAPSTVPVQSPRGQAVWVSAQSGLGMAALQTQVLRALAIPQILCHPVIDITQSERLNHLILCTSDAEVRAILDEISSADVGIF